MWPDGLTPIIEYVTGLGMEFGLWVEPEMVNPDSELYRAHPDWILHTDGRTPPSGATSTSSISDAPRSWTTSSSAWTPY